MFRTATFRTALARSLAIALAATLAAPLVCTQRAWAQEPRADRQRVDGRTLTLKYKDGEKKITVPANAPIVTYVPGDKGDIKPGAKVFIVAVKQADGTLQGRAWRIGRDGVIPPM